ncbi:hypothetical protein G7Z17_g3133 [Cylindrodendrum hubeiense]|uniref:DUF676 domain-containing protein n=1 Tax=Cylindrodendrum hubeiense TaxID=595255 RepID=A0A9P5LIG0_9HYPO|nr:hypothetical protein G7Z17_g3133 [Cylindrodendrum hubeiense]
MPRTLLLCFIHGFKGTDDTFHDFPSDLQKAVAQQLPSDRVESVVYPKYETKGELSEASEAFLEWLKKRVLDIRKEHSENPWPPNDRDVGVVLVAHSMGGFVASDSLFLALNNRVENADNDSPVFPPIQGILTFDTPYNGLARSMFVYGAFSNYSKVNSVFNVMTALSAAAPASLARLSARSTATTAATTAGSPQWKVWQLVAVRTGTVGAIAAGGVAAYKHREAIMNGMKSVKSINKESVVEGYRQSVDALGQGLAYINRGNVGKSFAWLSDHFTYVGALLKQKELSRRIERMGALKGIGIHDFYCSLGENGYWSGGYFVPERTFCAIPEESHPAHGLFSRRVLPKIDDEIQAHLSMFRPEKHAGYKHMTEESAVLVKSWFLSEEPVFDDPKFQETPGDEASEDATVAKILEEPEKLEKAGETVEEKEDLGSEQPDESPIDITAAASLVPLPSDEGDLLGDASTDSTDDNPEKRNYLNHLFQVAQQAGTGLAGVKGWLPSKMPQMPSKMPQMPSIPNMPSMPSVPTSVSSLGQVSMPSVKMFSKKDAKHEVQKGEGTEEVQHPASGTEATEKSENGKGEDNKAT